MDLFPIFLKLEKRACLVVGAGPIGEEKIGGLLNTGADVAVIAPKATETVQNWAKSGKIRWHERAFRKSDLDGIFLIVAATSDSALHDEIYKEARRRGILCNVVDDPLHCDFYYGSVVRRGPLQLSISTAGLSPALAQRLRKHLEKKIGPEYAQWVKELGEVRERLFQKKMDPARRKQLLHRLASREGYETFVKREASAKKKSRGKK